jgi:hypothetical protein
MPTDYFNVLCVNLVTKMASPVQINRLVVMYNGEGEVYCSVRTAPLNEFGINLIL